MPLVQCDKCGKKLNAKDEWIGRKLKCPGCGATFAAVSTSVSTPSQAPAQSAGPGKKPVAATAADRALKRSAPAGKYKGGGVSVNWGIVALAVGALLVVLGVCWFVFGPVKNNRQWNEKYDDAVADVQDLIFRVIAVRLEALHPQQLDEDGEPLRGGPPPPTPDVSTPFFLFQSFQLGMPETVEFRGTANFGPYEGVFHLDGSDKVVVNLTLDDGLKRVEGTVKDGTVEYTIDSKAP